MRVTTNLDNPLSWGFVLQGLYWQFEEDDNNIEGQAAIGPCWRQDGLVLYGGPMAHFYRAEGNGGLLGGAELDQESWFGGYLGGGIEVDRRLSFTAEFQATGDAWCAGGMLAWRF
ncbi:MAG: hypothetical protein A2Y77_16240 [Planctomycetes bacterium RBG_13_62_9]|nr:MAG: hypothetical protein A2Y77_16240 [Planctomycetes bacterium RBG_13_62_9]